mgnify:CR=1 FL=1
MIDSSIHAAAESVHAALDLVKRPGVGEVLDGVAHRPAYIPSQIGKIGIVVHGLSFLRVFPERASGKRIAQTKRLCPALQKEGIFTRDTPTAPSGVKCQMLPLLFRIQGKCDKH